MVLVPQNVTVAFLVLIKPLQATPSARIVVLDGTPLQAHLFAPFAMLVNMPATQRMQDVKHVHQAHTPSKEPQLAQPVALVHTPMVVHRHAQQLLPCDKR